MIGKAKLSCLISTQLKLVLIDNRFERGSCQGGCLGMGGREAFLVKEFGSSFG